MCRLTTQSGGSWGSVQPNRWVRQTTHTSCANTLAPTAATSKPQRRGQIRGGGLWGPPHSLGLLTFKFRVMSLRRKNGFILVVKDRQTFFRTSHQSWHRFHLQIQAVLLIPYRSTAPIRDICISDWRSQFPSLTERDQVPLQQKSKFLKPKPGYGLIWDVGKIYFTAAFLSIADCIMRGAGEKKDVFINRHAWFGGWWHGALWPTFYFHTFKYSGTWNRALLKTKAQMSELG